MPVSRTFVTRSAKEAYDLYFEPLFRIKEWILSCWKRDRSRRSQRDFRKNVSRARKMADCRIAVERGVGQQPEEPGPRRLRKAARVKLVTLPFIGLGLVLGLCLALISEKFAAGSTANVFLLTAGSGVISTALISIVLDLTWSKVRTAVESQELEPVFKKFQELSDQLQKLHGRMKAFEQLGLNYCHPSRSDALARFLGYANDLVAGANEPCDPSLRGAISIVSSSARGLIGYLDSEPQKVQRDWRELIRNHPSGFRILLTHPAYAHLRQPAEERSPGAIELEILKTAIYLHCVAGMKEAQLRLYRGSPTVFTIKVQQHILLNPYPYGKMAMDTLCLEFESAEDTTYIGDFVNMHFEHTWAFIEHDSNLVDGRPLVAGIGSFQDILDAFSECTYLGEPKRLRLASAQVRELDRFARNQRDTCAEDGVGSPFMDCVRSRGMKCSDEDLFGTGGPNDIGTVSSGIIDH